MRLRRSIGAPVAAMVGDPDVLAYAAAVVANGGTVSTARYPILTAFIGAEKAAGLWALTDDYMGLLGENATQALTSLKQRRLATVSGTPTFTADRGYAFNGTDNHVDTGFVPGTHAVAMTATSIHAEAYEITNVNAANATTLGCNSGSNRTIGVRPRDGSTAQGFGGSAVGTFTLSSADSRGLTQMGRNGSLVTDCYGAKNGVDLTRSVDPAGVGASLPSHSFFIGAANNSGTAGQRRAGSVAYVAWGAALSQSQRLARYTNVQAWATAVGANV